VPIRLFPLPRPALLAPSCGVAAGEGDDFVRLYRLSLTGGAAPPALAAAGPRRFGAGDWAGLPRFRRLRGAPYGSGANVWANGGWSRVETEARASANLRSAAGWTGALGANAGLNGGRIGAAVGYQNFKDDFDGGAGVDARGWGGSIYAGYAAPGGFYVQGSVGYAPKVRLNRVSLAGAYGAMAASAGKARVRGASAQMGLTASGLIPGWRAGPFVSAEYLDVDLRAAAGRTDVTGAAQTFGRARYSAGLEGFGKWAGMLPSVQFAYVRMDQVGDRSAFLVLDQMRRPFAAGRAPLDGLNGDYVLAGAALDGLIRGVGWRASVEERLADHTEFRAGLGFSKRF
jgi:hypothetical protein